MWVQTFEDRGRISMIIVKYNFLDCMVEDTKIWRAIYLRQQPLLAFERMREADIQKSIIEKPT